MTGQLSLFVTRRDAPPDRLDCRRFGRVACPVCHAGPGEPCSGSWEGQHGQRYAIVGAMEQLEAEHGAEPPVLPPAEWAVAWLMGDDGPIEQARRSGRVLQGFRRKHG